jgi:hypothetical protein
MAALLPNWWRLGQSTTRLVMVAANSDVKGAVVATCSAGRCKIACDGGCGCVYVHEEDRCICECFESGGSGIRGLKLNPTATVSVSVSGLPLGQVATMFDRILARDVMLPAARAQKKVRLKLENVKVSEALNTLGLTTRTPTPSTRRSGTTGRVT